MNKPKEIGWNFEHDKITHTTLHGLDDDYDYGKKNNPWWKRMEQFVKKTGKEDFKITRRFRYTGSAYKEISFKIE
jgi:hypothetical protein